MKPIKMYAVVFKDYNPNAKVTDFMFTSRKKALEFIGKSNAKIIRVEVKILK
jgi:hypothetical protein